MDLTNHFNRQANKIAVSSTRQLDGQVSGTENIPKLTLGEPDFNTSGHVKETTKGVIGANFSHCTRMLGLLDVRKTVTYFMKEEYYSVCQPATEILVTIGTAGATSASLLTVLEQGDKVLLLAPIYPRYEPVITLVKTEPVYSDTRDNSFTLTSEMIGAAMAGHGEQIKAIILSYPSNSAGVAYNHQELQAIADTLKKYDIFAVSDEVYSELTYGEGHVSIIEILRDQTILISGLSKSRVMASWQTDFIFASTVLTAEIIKIHQYLVATTATVSQKAVVHTPIEGMYDIEIMKEEYRGRHDSVYEQMTQLRFEVARPNGTFYVLTKIPIGYEQDSMKFCIDLARGEAVALISGISFDPEIKGYARVSCASDIDKLTTAMERTIHYVVT